MGSNLVELFGPGGFRAGMTPPRAVGEPPEPAFLDVMCTAGYQLERVISDGEIHRCRDPDDKRSGDAGWYWLRVDGARAVGCFGSWRLGGYDVWVQGADNGDNRLSAQEMAQVRRLIEAQRVEREAAAAASHETAARFAAEQIAHCVPASAEHPYLVKKGVAVHGISQLDQTLIVPRYTLDGALHSFQTIDAAGAKRYQSGGRAKGTCLPMGDYLGAPFVALCEGYATAATVREATGWPTVVCFDSGNLSEIAPQIRAQCADARIVICADDDASKPGNPGLAKAREAARAVGGIVLSPPGLHAGETDWNDLAGRLGREAVAEALTSTASPQALHPWPLKESFTAQPEPLRWVVDGWLVRGYLNLVAADGGTGKTTAFQQLACCVATAKPWLGQPVTPGAVLLVLCEDDRAAILRRQATIDQYLQLQAGDYQYPVMVLPRLAESNFLAERESKTGQWRVTDFFIEMLKLCKKLKPALVVLDSLSDVYPGNEIDRAEVSNFVSLTFARLAAECDTALVVLAHTPKAPANGKAATYSGSTAWNNKARVRVSLGAEEGSSDRLLMKVEKSNYGPTGAHMKLRRFAGVLMSAEELPQELREAEAARAGDTRTAFLTMLKECLDASQNLSTKLRAPGNYAPAYMVKHQSRHGVSHNKAAYENAMHALLKEGVIEVEETNSGRNHRLLICHRSAPWEAEN